MAGSTRTYLVLLSRVIATAPQKRDLKIARVQQSLIYRRGSFFLGYGELPCVQGNTTTKQWNPTPRAVRLLSSNVTNACGSCERRKTCSGHPCLVVRAHVSQKQVLPPPGSLVRLCYLVIRKMGCPYVTCPVGFRLSHTAVYTRRQLLCSQDKRIIVTALSHLRRFENKKNSLPHLGKCIYTHTTSQQ